MTDLMAATSNYFINAYEHKQVEVVDSKINVNADYVGNYIALHYGNNLDLYKVKSIENGIATLEQEGINFNKEAYLLYLDIPIQFIELNAKIGEFQAMNAHSAIISESVTGYSYSKDAEIVKGGWETAFKNEIKRYKKLPTTLGEAILRSDNIGT